MSPARPAALLLGSLASRRGFLASAIGALATAACGAARPPEQAPKPDEPAPIHVAELTDVLPHARLRWLILARPREIAAVPWLIPPIGKVVPEANLDRFAVASGIDLRQVTDAAIASYAGDGGDATLYLARHTGDPAAIERAFRTRLTRGEHRALERPDVVRVSGTIGASPTTLILLGRDVAGVQTGGSATRGPARIATLYAAARLTKSPTALALDPLRALAARFGGAPLRAMALGPFEGELARGARGLLAGATAIGASARPSAREGVALVIAVAGDFTKSGAPASQELADAWHDLAGRSFGRLLGLDQPVDPPLATHSAEAVAIAVELNAQKLADGLAAATSSRIEEIMR